MPASPNLLVVIGSLNVDYLGVVEELPRPGQTVPASALDVRFGGKGANQAVAAARQGARVKMIGCLGTDSEGRAYLRRLRHEGIDGRAIRRVDKIPTGRAFISVDRHGENTIVVAAGANNVLHPRHLSERYWRGAAMVLLQLEVPVPTVVAALRRSQELGVATMLNAAPFRGDFPWQKVSLDYLVVNEHEVAELLGTSPGASVSEWASAVRARLSRLCVRHLIVTRGARPTWCLSAEQTLSVPVMRVRPVDTVGAGDAFAGTLAAHLVRGTLLREALMLANCAGALATQALGAQESLPTLAQTLRLNLTHKS